MPRQFFVGGNFKMNGTIKSIKDIISGLNDAKLDGETEVVISPPSLYLLLARENLKKGIEVAAQNVFDKPNGAFTGEISVEQLKDSGITWTILGHSERRTLLAETDDFVASKTKVATDGGLSVILCCGETLEQREAGTTTDVVTSQLKAVADKISDWSKIVIAYEPIWAIGTGKVASTEQAQEVHAAIRKWLSDAVSSDAAEATRILYGGSVSEKNCVELAKQPDIDGFLVGGASLKPAFYDIINAKAGAAKL
ncbi:Triosephosphate isomerase [Aulographum hederae CBS 113979]|uniref:Triosephosphate isomerase n=1 Tax=Aulographum hederae CBS 113979 TaxID=1176131 RepID=A0A6G1HAG4_9PEZI|nr:Triosephosphate isomerase [Aulographum hederae CBS 113979]